MTRLVVIGRTGPSFREPRSLADTLQASVDYNAERERQAESPPAYFVDSDSLPTEYALTVTHNELARVVSRG